MTPINDAVVAYIAAWNEPDAARRASLVARAWNENGSYLDAHRAGTGHAQIAAMIGAVQERFPGYRFRLSSGIEAHHNQVRFSWIAGGTPDSPLYFGGTDFGDVGADGRFRSVTGFTDAMPHLG